VCTLASPPVFIPPPCGEVRHAAWRAGVGARTATSTCRHRLAHITPPGARTEEGARHPPHQGEGWSVSHRQAWVILAAGGSRPALRQSPSVSQRSATKWRGQRDADRPRSYCSSSGQPPGAPLAALILKPRIAAYHLSGSDARMEITHLTRRPTRYRAGGRTGDPRGWSVSLARVSGRIGNFRFRQRPSRTAPPRAPRPSPREADGLQLASSWTRDGCIVRAFSRAGLTRG
jgi:hypothetical protein